LNHPQKAPAFCLGTYQENRRFPDAYEFYGFATPPKMGGFSEYLKIEFFNYVKG